MNFDILHLLDPAAVIHAKSFQAALTGDFVEAGLGDPKQRSGWGLFQSEFDECWRFR